MLYTYDHSPTRRLGLVAGVDLSGARYCPLAGQMRDSIKFQTHIT